MSIDLSKIKSRLNTLQNSQSSKSVMWRPVVGKQVIRIVPYKFNPSNPFFEGLFHYNIGGKTILSPATFGDADPVLEFANNLKRTGEKEDWRAAKRMEPKLRTYAPVIVRGEENEGVRFYGFGKTVYQELLGVIDDPDYGDITDPLTGRDITIEYISAEEAGKSYPETRIRVKPNPTPLDEDQTRAASFLENQQKIDDIWTVPTYNEMKAYLEQWLNPTEETEETEDKSNSDNASQSGGFALNTPASPAAEATQPTAAAIYAPAPTVAVESKERASKVDQVNKDFDALFSG